MLGLSSLHNIWTLMYCYEGSYLYELLRTLHNLQKASAAAAAEAEALDKETNTTSVEKDEGGYGMGKTQWGSSHTSPCPSGELRCVDGRCITLAQLCDGAIDCSDHADEDNCYT